MSALILALFIALVPPVANADWKDGLGTFRVSVVIQENMAATLARMEPFRLAVAEQLGVPVEIIGERDLATLIRNHAEGRDEYAVMSATAYGAAWSLCECVEPLVMARSADGSSQSSSILITRKNNSINTPQQAVGRKIIALNRDSILGFAYAVHELKQQKIDLMTGSTEFVFFENAEAALAAFANGEGDVLIGWTGITGNAADENKRGTLVHLAALDPDITADLRVIWTSGGIPHRVHSIRKNLDGEPKRLLRELLSGLNDNDPVAYDAIEPDYSGGFVIANQTEFFQIAEFVRSPLPTVQQPAASTDAVKPAPGTGTQ